MANVLNEEKKQQVLALGRLGWSLRRIQQATGIRRETAGVYLKAAGIAVRPPSGWGRREPKPANEVITDSGAAKPAIPVIPAPLDPNCNPNPNPNPKNLSNRGKAKATSKPANEEITDSAVVTGASVCEPYREAIDLGLSRGRNAMAIWQDLVSEYGFASSYQSVQRFVRKRRGTQTPEARVVIVTAAGQEAQVDYGTGPMVRDPESRKYRRTRLFVMTLGCSRKSVRLLTFRSSSRIWAELHERAFRRLGGATRTLALLDAYRLAMTQHSPIDGEGIVADLVSVRHTLGERGFHLAPAGVLERGDRLRWREEVHRHITASTQRGLKLF